MAERIESLDWEAIHAEIESLQLSADPVEEQLGLATLGHAKRKHLTQISSLVGHLLSNSLLPNSPNHCTVELGSGKAQLSYWMIEQCSDASYLLVDRQGVRGKYDKRALKVCFHFLDSS